jgi:hypothetical protein
MQRIITNTLSFQPYLPRIAAGLAGLCALAIFLYGVFLLLAVMHTAARTSVEKQIGTTVAALGDLEATYLAQTKSLTPEYAAALGFTAPSAVSVVFTAAHTLGRSEAGALSLNTR